MLNHFFLGKLIVNKGNTFASRQQPSEEEEKKAIETK
jgi:hypothetical protein